MPARHYDVVVLGRSVGALLCAALLARRELRVLVLGQGQLPASYKVEGQLLFRRSFSLLAATSPVFRRILTDLAQSQNFRRVTHPLDPMFAMLYGNVRFEVPPDIDLFGREILREFPEVQQSIAELYAQISSDNGQMDAAWERDVVWPPGNFFERLETSRVAAGLPTVHNSGTQYLLERLPAGHDFRKVVEVSSVFASHMGLSAESLNSLALARLHGSWTRGVHSLVRGEQELEDFLVSRIEAHGGLVRFDGRAEKVVVRRGRIAGIIEQGEESLTAAEAVVSATMGEALAELSDGQGIANKARDHWPRVEVVGGRFVVSLVVDNRGLPAPLPKESFLVGDQPSLVDVHLQRFAKKDLLPSSQLESDERPTTLLVAEMLLPLVGGVHLLGAREAVLATLRRYLPFLDEHLLLVDSPHDALPATVFEKDESGRRRARSIERIHLRSASPSAEAMQPRIEVDAPSYFGLVGEPLRGPIPGSYLVGPSVLPALGQEGEAMAAWGVAKILTKKDRTRQKMRRQMWTKIETG